MTKAKIDVHEPCGAMPIEEVVADKSYHAAATVTMCDVWSFRSYIPEPELADETAGHLD